MVKVKLQPSARLEMHANNPAFTTTEEDLPPKHEVVIPGYPSVGDYIESADNSGRTWEVTRIYWTINDEVPIVEVE